MADEDDRLIDCTPGGEERADVLLGKRVVPAPPDGVIETLLDIDDDKGVASPRR